LSTFHQTVTTNDISNCVTWELISRVKAGIPVPVKHIEFFYSMNKVDYIPDPTRTRGYGYTRRPLETTLNYKGIRRLYLLHNLVKLYFVLFCYLFVLPHYILNKDFHVIDACSLYFAYRHSKVLMFSKMGKFYCI